MTNANYLNTYKAEDKSSIVLYVTALNAKQAKRVLISENCGKGWQIRLDEKNTSSGEPGIL